MPMFKSDVFQLRHKPIYYFFCFTTAKFILIKSFASLRFSLGCFALLQKINYIVLCLENFLSTYKAKTNGFIHLLLIQFH